jgi:hypothetical protein
MVEFFGFFTVHDPVTSFDILFEFPSGVVRDSVVLTASLSLVVAISSITFEL